MLASFHWLTVADEVQPLRSVRATAVAAMAERAREMLRTFIFRSDWLCLYSASRIRNIWEYSERVAANVNECPVPGKMKER